MPLTSLCSRPVPAVLSVELAAFAGGIMAVFSYLLLLSPVLPEWLDGIRCGRRSALAVQLFYTACDTKILGSNLTLIYTADSGGVNNFTFRQGKRHGNFS